MPLRKPAGGLDFLTTLWVMYGIGILWLIPAFRTSWFGLMLLCGVAASIGIWRGVKLCGYFFASANLTGAILSLMTMLGYIADDRSSSPSRLITFCVLLHCAYVGVAWANSEDIPRHNETDSQEENAR